MKNIYDQRVMIRCIDYARGKLILVKLLHLPIVNICKYGPMTLIK